MIFAVLQSQNLPVMMFLSKCFLAGFLKHEQLYLREMTCILLGESISFDQTFKVANIGYLTEDGKWIPEYDRSFIVLITYYHGS